MWIWTCVACKRKFKHETKLMAESLFLAHTQTHTPSIVFSYNEEKK